ncbi:MAG: AMP-binding protein, partial [Verrucomicrobiae bacterium]|nr:AMP-binding protein [Verrucomicrobiae bacterium]
MSIVQEACSALPGTFLSLDESGVKVATETYPVKLVSLYTLDGKSITVQEAIALAGISLGELFPIPDANQRSRLTQVSNAMIRQDGFWRQKLSELRPVTLSGLTNGISYKVENPFSQIRLKLSGLQIAPEKSSEFVLAAWASFTFRLSGEEIFDLEYFDGELTEKWESEEALISRYVPLRIEVDPDLPFEEFLNVFRGRMEVVKRHPFYSRDLVIRNPILQAQESLQRFHKLPTGIGRIARIPETGGLDLNGMESMFLYSEEDAAVHFSFDQLAMSREHAERLLESFKVFLKALHNNASQSINEVGLTPADQIASVLRLGQGKEVNFPLDKGIHQFIEIQVKERPDAIAVECEGRTLTYRQLNSAANQLAFHLLKKGVKPDQVVGLCLDRSFEMIVAMYGILKSGAAYLPLDPNYPQDRIKFMVRDADVVCVVSDKTHADLVS